MPRSNSWFAWSLLLVFVPALGAEPTLSAQDLIDQGAVRLSPDGTRALLAAGADIQLIAPGSGNLRKWVHGADGQFTATSIGSTGRATNAPGRWRVLDNGQYCVEIAWVASEEKWCRVLYRVGAATYAAPADLAGNADKRYGRLKVAGQPEGEIVSPAMGAATPSTQAMALPRPALSDGAPQKQYFTKAEMQQMLPGKSVLFQRTAESIQWDIRADGQLYGVNRSRGLRDAGAWLIGEDGGFCIKWRGGSRDSCYYLFKNGERLSMTDSNLPTATISADILEIK